MTTELAKQYDPATVEPTVARRWLEANAFHADPHAPGEPYCIVIPPPNVTAALHMGHALNNTLQDILIRWHRMLGDNAVWIPGSDHAGIATQTVVEKQVLAQEGKRRTDFDRETFVAKIRDWKDHYEQRITEQLKMMGCSCDWERQRFTMDAVCAAAVREAFFRFFRDGLIYRGKRLVNWDPATRTALADDEVEMRDIDGHFWYLRYPLVNPVTIDGKSVDHLTVATTRPETMLGDTAVAMNPADPRAEALVGQQVRLPIVNRVIPVVADDFVVLPDPNSADAKAQFATGFLKVTPAHDPNDWEIGQRHGLEIINVMGPDGAISDQHGWPAEDIAAADGGVVPLGLDRYEAREAIVDWFRQNRLLEEVRPYRHAVGHSYRSHVPIEPYLSDQWYVKVTDDRLANAALRAMADDQFVGHNGSKSKRTTQGKAWEGRLRFTPSRYAKTFQNWHENLRDWCISRQLWWGHRIPVWSISLPESSVSGIEADRQAQIHRWEQEGRIAGHLAVGCDRDVATERQHHLCVRSDDDQEIIGTIERWGYRQDVDVLDTWFSSALWPFSTLGWPADTAELQTWNPGRVLCTAREIITLWVSRMVMINLYMLDRLPFEDVFIHAMIQDGQGRKMSKSLGNGVDPLDIIRSHGADAMRHTLAVMTTQTQDVRLPVTRDPQTGHNSSDKFDLGRNFANKLWNATRFALERLGPAGGGGAEQNKATTPVALADRWILSRLAAVVRDTNAALERYDFNSYAQGLYDFFRRDLCDWYIEAIKPTVSQDRVASQTLAACIDASLRLLHPVMPFITEKLWEKLNEVAPLRQTDGVTLPPSELVINAAWPRVDPRLIDESCEVEFALIHQVVTALRQVRTTQKVPPRQLVAISAQAPAAVAQQLLKNQQLIETLAVVEMGSVGPAVDQPTGAAVALVGQARLHLHGLVDQDAEKDRLKKRIQALVKNIGALKGRLANRSYLEKAPPNLVQQTKDQLEAAQKEERSVQQQLAALG